MTHDSIQMAAIVTQFLIDNLFRAKANLVYKGWMHDDCGKFFAMVRRTVRLLFLNTCASSIRFRRKRYNSVATVN